jgi:hypothetical protein
MEGAAERTTGGQPAFRTLMLALAAASQAAARVSVVHAPPKREMQVGARGDMRDDSFARSNRVLQGNQPVDMSGFTVREHVHIPTMAMFCQLLARAR